MTLDTNETKNIYQYIYYAEQIRTAHNRYRAFTIMAAAIALTREYNQAEKGQALETLTKAWIDFCENK